MQNTDEQTKNAGGKKKDYLLPASIVIAALLVGGAVVWSAIQKAPAQNAQNPAPEDPAKLAENVKPVTESDHILGNANAPVKMITFTDFECPFCKEFHPVLKQVLQAYGDKVAVVYRDFPLSQIHQYAENEAEAAECAADLGGNQRFWDFVDKMFETTRSGGTGLDPKLLPQFASEMGIDAAKFNDCLSSHKFAAKVAAEEQDGIAAGGQGTPFSVVISQSGRKYVIPGALPFENPQDPSASVKAIIDQALANG